MVRLIAGRCQSIQRLEANRLMLPRGFALTKTQLARWHRAGLLPQPRQRGLGRGKGTSSIYPNGTGNQLRALLEIHARERRLPFVAWKLGWEGFEVPIEQIRAFIEWIATEWERAIHALIKEGELTKSGRAFIRPFCETCLTERRKEQAV